MKLERKSLTPIISLSLDNDVTNWLYTTYLSRYTYMENFGIHVIVLPSVLHK